MKNIKFQHVAILVALAIVVWLYFENKKKADAAVKVMPADDTGTAVTTKESPKNTVSAGSGGGNIILINPPAPISYTPGGKYTNGAFYGNVAAGGGGTPMNNSNENQSGGGATLGSGSGTSFSGGGF